MAARIDMAAAVTSGSGKSRSLRMPVHTVSHRSAVRRVERMRSKASFFETAEAGEATISSTADFAMTEISRPAADCCSACSNAPDCRSASKRISAGIFAEDGSSAHIFSGIARNFRGDYCISDSYSVPENCTGGSIYGDLNA
ncbi:von Willebrand factor C domain-containing protein [Striga asiatica]|uniref:von Willebrand factor C domain-containing protein n=1 Tax=Striga asiatica TaxID=4170 RepID=A0A5A7QST3_STRAF|nr:von Willebrand factor C domain-containing protein [Striga asiatica]